MPASPSPVRRVAWGLAGLLAVGAWTGAALFASATMETQRQRARQVADRAAAVAAEQVAQRLAPALATLAEAEAAQAALRAGPPAAAAARARLEEALARAGLQFALVTDPAGRVVLATHRPLVGRLLAEQEALALHRAGRGLPVLAPAVLGLPGDPPSLLLSRLLEDGSGVVAVGLDPRRLEAALAGQSALPGLRFGLRRADGLGIGAGLLGPPSGNHLAIATRPLPVSDLLAYAALEDSTGHAAARQLALAGFALAGLATLLLAALAVLAGRRAAPAQALPLDAALPAAGYRAVLEPGGTLRLTGIGPGVERLTGWTPEAALRPGWRRRNLDPATLPLGPDLPERLRNAPEAATEYRFRRADGGWMWLRETARVLGRGPDGAELAGALEDISAERELALQAAAAAKFATLGEMAAGLAHELNQPIAIMSLAAENAAEALEGGTDGIDDALARLRRIMVQAERAKAIVTQLRSFARVDLAEVEPVDLAAAVQGMAVLAGQALRDAQVELELRLPDALPPVVGQAVLVEQVLLNLALNARDALAELPPGARRLRVEAQTGPGADEVSLSVTDSGPGIPAEVLERIFEPFFTTKPPGQGTGLGLSICRTIMRGLGGRIEAGNARAEGLGARFALVFRRAQPGAGARAAAAEDAPLDLVLPPRRG